MATTNGSVLGGRGPWGGPNDPRLQQPPVTGGRGPWGGPNDPRLQQGGGIPGQMGPMPSPNTQPPQQAPMFPPTGLIGSEQALQGGLQASLDALMQGYGQGRSDVTGQFNRGARGLNPFIQPGQQAQGLQAAFSGALGPEAQAQAFAQYRDSPGQAYLRERGERAVTRNASALGGLGGGRVMQELQRQGIGLAEQAYGADFDRLGQVAGQGLQAAGMAGNLYGQAGQTLGNMGMQAGIQGSNLAQQAGRDLAAGRTQAGRDLAGNIDQNTSNLAGLIENQGAGLSDLLGGQGNTLATLLQNAGLTQGMSQQDLLALLSGQSLTTGGQYGGLPGIPGIQETEGRLGSIGRFLSGVGSVMTPSDRRLKENIVPIGTTPGGRNIYQWDWNEEGQRVAGDDPTVGIIAQENMDIAVPGPEGYLAVDLSQVT